MEISPSDARAGGREGDMVEVRSRLGGVRGRARVSGIRPGVLPRGWKPPGETRTLWRSSTRRGMTRMRVALRERLPIRAGLVPSARRAGRGGCSRRSRRRSWRAEPRRPLVPFASALVVKSSP
nr:molybdopterin dinucleotide binding domain-containing protein [Nocardiopsis sp. L17-MgMaSL7]